MKKLIFLFLLLVLSSFVLAVPVTYKGIIEDSDLSVNKFIATSNIGNTTIIHNQTNNQTSFILNHLENNQELVEFFYKNEVVRRNKQNLPGSIIDLGTIFVEKNDTDKDGIPDESDSCPYVYDTTNSSSSCLNDEDGDGVNNSKDHLIGDANLVNTNFETLKLLIDRDSNVSKVFENISLVNYTSEGKEIVSFNFDFNYTNLSNNKIEIFKQNSSENKGWIRIKGINLTGQSQTKTVYLDKINSGTSAVCIKDLEIASISEMTDDCTGANEKNVNCDGVTRYGYTCSVDGTRYKVEGLTHSAVKQNRCIEDWSKGEWSGNNCGTRTCTDNNACGTTTNKPPTSKSCSSHSRIRNTPTTTTTTIAPTTTTIEAIQVEPEKKNTNEEEKQIIGTSENENKNQNKEDSSIKKTNKKTGLEGITGNVISNVQGGSSLIAIFILVFVIVGLFIGNRYLGGMPWENNQKKAQNFHRRAENAYKKGKHKTSKKLYHKAERIRYKL